MVELDDEKVFYAFDKTLEPAMVVPSGTTVLVSHEGLLRQPGFKSPKTSCDGIDWGHTNSGYGPHLRGGGGSGRRAQGERRCHRVRQQVGFLHGRKRGRLRRSFQCLEHSGV